MTHDNNLPGKFVISQISIQDLRQALKFVGNPISCPEESSCYCDGFGVCFGGPKAYAELYKLQEAIATTKKQIEIAIAGESINLIYLREKLDALIREEQKLTAEALERGQDSHIRAQELNREIEQETL